MFSDELKRMFLDEITSHEGALIELASCIQARMVDNPNPNYLVTPYTQLSHVKERIERLKARKERILRGGN